MNGFEIGSVLFNKYRVEDLLGEGSFGKVICARHLQLNKRFAIKILKIDAKTSDAMLKRFLFEARIASSLESEHAVKVMDYGALDTGEPYMIMEHLLGADLSKVPRAQGKFPVETAVDFVLQALEALSEAHSHNIVHRDLKPGNLFLVKRADGIPTVKVLDFGISKFCDTDSPEGAENLTQTGMALGTPVYMAPEQFLMPQKVDGRADLWALGVILYNFLTGTTPFRGENLAVIMTKVLHAQPAVPSSLNPEIPAELDAVILRCLEKDRAKRFGDAAELAAALSPFALTQARISVPWIHRVLGLPVIPLPSGAARTGGFKREGGALTISDASTELYIGGRASGAPDTLARSGLTRTMDRIKAAAHTTSMMVAAALVCSVLLGGVVFMTIKNRNSSNVALARPALKPDQWMPPTALPPAPAPLPEEEARIPEPEDVGLKKPDKPNGVQPSAAPSKDGHRAAPIEGRDSRGIAKESKSPPEAKAAAPAESKAPVAPIDTAPPKPAKESPKKEAPAGIDRNFGDDTN